MKQLIKKIYYRAKLKKEFKEFLSTKKTSNSGYAAMRQMFVLTHGKSNDELSDSISKNEGKYQNLDFNGVLGFADIEALSASIEAMRRDGYFIFEKKLSEDIVEEITRIALQTRCSFLDVETNKYNTTDLTKFDEKKPVSPRYDIPIVDIINNEVIQNLIFDSSLLTFAQEYLGVRPILDLIAFWWSAPFNGKGASAAAQMYHFDLDRIKFMKFFFYLTDVDTETGPHCYVKGSHQTLPNAINRDGRFTDQEITTIYGSDKMLELCGKKGTIMAVDTRGFHKGKELLRDKRLLFQIEFANSMFGQSYPPIKIIYANELNKSSAKKYAHTYQQILLEDL